MQNLELFLDLYDNNEINMNIYNKYKIFGYEDKDAFILDLNFLLKNIYDIKLISIEDNDKRIGQQEFKKILLKKYGFKCLITNNDCIDELEACHIVPESQTINFDISNGLILDKNIHSTFNKYYWSINPETLEVEVLNNKNVGSISKYKNMYINLGMTYKLKQNLIKHYAIFTNYKN